MSHSSTHQSVITLSFSFRDFHLASNFNNAQLLLLPKILFSLSVFVCFVFQSNIGNIHDCKIVVHHDDPLLMVNGVCPGMEDVILMTCVFLCHIDRGNFDAISEIFCSSLSHIVK